MLIDKQSCRCYADDKSSLNLPPSISWHPTLCDTQPALFCLKDIIPVTNIGFYNLRIGLPDLNTIEIKYNSAVHMLLSTKFCACEFGTQSSSIDIAGNLDSY